MEAKNPSTKRYPPELKERAVRMVLDLQRQDPLDHTVISRVARQLGVGLESLRTWVKRSEVDAGTRPGVTTSEHDELVELICHTDAGSQYTSILYTERLGEVGAAPSIGTIGDCLFTGYYDWMESERSLRRLQDSAA